MTMPSHAADLSSHWHLDPAVTFLNHGSFGACPKVVLEAQRNWALRLERQPIRFMDRELEGLLDEARTFLARFVGAPPDDLAFVTNATEGVNTVLRSLRFEPGDELLVTDHAYNACRNALLFAAERSGAVARLAKVPFPLTDPGQVVEAVLAEVGPKTRLALVDHVTSPTGLVFPVGALVKELEGRGVRVLVDGAHAPGMLDLNLKRLGASYYTGNCHKWLCAPKGAGFLFVRRDRQREIRPLSISHGANSPRTDRSRFRLEFDWTGTFDPTPFLCVPLAIRFMATLVPGGWETIYERNRALALEARALLSEALNAPLPCPESMIGSLAAIPLPDAPEGSPPPPLDRHPLHETLVDTHSIEVPVLPWPAHPRRLVRVSAQLYNHRGQYEALAQALRVELENERSG